MKNMQNRSIEIFTPCSGVAGEGEWEQ